MAGKIFIKLPGDGQDAKPKEYDVNLSDQFGTFLQTIVDDHKYDLEAIRFTYEENVGLEKKMLYVGDEDEANLKDNKFKIN